MKTACHIAYESGAQTSALLTTDSLENSESLERKLEQRDAEITELEQTVAELKELLQAPHRELSRTDWDRC
jgi:hypothetical protein